jgi:predicted dehydrogenase
VSTLAAQDAFSGDVEAYASMQMRMTGGIFAHVVANARTPYRTLLEVSGSEGMLSSESAFSVDQPVEVVLRKGGKIVETNSFDNSDGYALMLDSFAAAVRGEGRFAATGEDGVRNMLALDAAYTSWKSGRPESAE